MMFHGNNYSSQQLIKAASIFLTTHLSYHFLSLCNSVSATAEQNNEKNGLFSWNEITSLAVTKKRMTQQLTMLPPFPYNLSTLSSTYGFRIPGLFTYDHFGYSVSTAKDFNGDGFPDLLLGAFNTSSGGLKSVGAAYVVFGQPSSWPANFSLTALNGSNGFIIPGLNTSDYLGYSVSSAGDFNGDGFSDLLLGAYNSSASGQNSAGVVYVVFGRSSGWSTSFDLNTLDGSKWRLLIR